jgi:hypothetical protein
LNRSLLVFTTICFLILACSHPEQKTVKADTLPDMNRLAADYIRLGLRIGQYDEVFVDAYYGPDSLKPTAPESTAFPRDSFLKEVDRLLAQCTQLKEDADKNDTLRDRADWVSKQLVAFGRRIKIFSGDTVSFDEEARELFDATVPVYTESHFKTLVASLDSILPGKGSIPERVQARSKKFIIPANKVDTVFKAAYLEARKRVSAHLSYPSGERFAFEYVHNKSWTGYNWYKGNYTSLIQQNLDLPIPIERAIDLACHEGYPGHHVYNMLLEKNLYHDRGWMEVSLYPLFSPQSLIAEGSANYGIEMAFPGDEKLRFTKEVLLPLAGLDTTGITVYIKMQAIRDELNYVRNEAARGLLNKTMDEKEVRRWLSEYMLASPATVEKYISFIRTNRSYVINYNYGKDLVKNYMEVNGGSAGNPEKRWELFGWLLSNEVTPQELLASLKK